MSVGLAFWIIMLCWAIFGIVLHFGIVAGTYGATVNVVLLFILFALLGYGIFGPPIHR